MITNIQNELLTLKELIAKGNKIINTYTHNKEDIEIIMQAIQYGEEYLTEGISNNILPKDNQTYEIAKDISIFFSFLLINNFEQMYTIVNSCLSHLCGHIVQLKRKKIHNKNANTIPCINAKITDADYIYNEIFIKNNFILYKMIDRYIKNTIPKVNIYLQNCIVYKYQELIKFSDIYINSILNKNTTPNSKRLALQNYSKNLKKLGIVIKLPNINFNERSCDLKKDHAKRKVKLNYNTFISVK